MKTRIIRIIQFLIFFLALWGTSLLNAEEPHPPWMGEQEWKNSPFEIKVDARALELMGRVNSYLALRGYQLGAGAESQFNHAIRGAAREIQSLNESFKRTRTEQAVTNFKIVIDTMIIESRRSPGYSDRSFRKIGEQTLSGALSQLCPIWPFCD